MRNILSTRQPRHQKRKYQLFWKGWRKMNINSVVAVIALVLIVFFAIRYIWKEKKRGTKCIGCPVAGNCHDYAGCGTSQTPPKKVEKMKFGQ